MDGFSCAASDVDFAKMLEDILSSPPPSPSADFLDEFMDDMSETSFESGSDGVTSFNSGSDGLASPVSDAEVSQQRKKKPSTQRKKQRLAANVRERRRMESINGAFDVLRKRVPTLAYERRISKADTLHLAIGYIRFLTDLVKSDTQGEGAVAHSRLKKPPKIIISHKGTGSMSPTDMEYGVPPLEGHSLSWTDERKPVSKGQTLVAKIWTPEDPRTECTKKSSSSLRLTQVVPA
ncbi:pancreas transcription factor 1 subunit alpha-like [Branchiostoma lanceolatum]|uniref:pancreas transcription factor 1 subunit alpha-like n=1 Tax=Branchiostoma lanceolatum TaxID=7740 RepID=UPI003455CB0D